MKGWLGAIFAILMIACGAVFWRQLVGLPLWLDALGVLAWLKGFDPLDKWVPVVTASLIGIYAIFHERIHKAHRRPKLKVLGNLDCIAIPINYFDPRTGQVLGTANSYQVRLIIRNDGLDRAEFVEVFAERLVEYVDGKELSCDWFMPMNLQWAHEEAMYTAISPNIQRTCNVVGFVESAAGMVSEVQLDRTPELFNYKALCIAQIQTIVKPTSFCYYVYPGRYRLDAVIAAANAEVQKASIHLKFNGTWQSEQKTMFADAVQVSVS